MIEIKENLTDANCVTHAGSFHADDIFATIFLEKIFQNIYLYRTNEITSDMKLEDKIVYDIGLGKFDHHQKEVKTRTNGIKYCSFGLLFEHFGRDYLKKLCPANVEEVYQMYLNEFVYQIDAIDNGIFPEINCSYKITTISDIIALFNKTWCEEKDSNLCFLECISVARVIYNRIEQRILDKIKAKSFVEDAIAKSESEILVLEKYMPFMDFLITSQNPKASQILFVITPSNRGGYSIQTVHKALDTYENRLDFPSEWGGLTKEELVTKTGIKTFRFCHKNLFCAASDTLEDALAIADLAIQKKKDLTFFQ